jgi:hypothetical protein
VANALLEREPREIAPTEPGESETEAT